MTAEGAPGVPREQVGRSRGVIWLAAATAIAGICGYAITWFVPRSLGFGVYADFAVFWGLLFFIVAVLSGIQQEVTRASHGAEGSRSRPGAPRTARPYVAALVTGAAVLLVVGGTAPLWGDVVFPGVPALAAPVAVGAAAYVAIAVTYGLLYGLGRWRILVSLILVEAVARLAGVVVAIATGTGVVGAAWATAGAYLLALAVHLVPLRRIRRELVLDVGYPALLRNSLRTVVASAALGLMVSGLPFLMGLADPGRSALLGSLVVVVTFSRAPIVIVLMAFQSLLLVTLRSDPDATLRRVRLLVGAIAAAAGVLAVLSYLLGPLLFDLLFGRGSGLPDWIFPVMVASSALVGISTVLGSALLGRERHGAYAAGWALGAVATAACFAAPAGLLGDTLLATLLAPTITLAALAVALKRSS